MRNVGVTVSHPDPGLVDEVVHAVEATPDLFLALDPRKAAVVFAGADAMRSLADEPNAPGVAIIGLAAEGELAEVARLALRCRAQDVLSWPAEGAALRTTVRDAASRARLAAGATDGKLVGVVGARGGAGATTIAAMLARGLAGSVVVDLDTVGGGQTLFVPHDTEPTLERVLDVVDELDAGAFRAALVDHASGRALCAPPRREPPARERVERLLPVLRASVPFAVLDLGRAADPGTRTAMLHADAVVCVLTPDLQSLRGARAMPEMPATRHVLNMSSRMRVSARDVRRVLGAPPAGVIPLDPAIRRASEAGRLATRGPGRRAVDRLATLLATEVAGGS